LAAIVADILDNEVDCEDTDSKAKQYMVAVYQQGVADVGQVEFDYMVAESLNGY
jgi:hypothetical protein